MPNCCRRRLTSPGQQYMVASKSMLNVPEWGVSVETSRYRVRWRTLFICPISWYLLHVNVKRACNKLNQVTSKLNYAHVGMYFIYRGAVSGSRGLMSLWITASLMSLDMLPVNESFTPKRFLNNAFASHPTISVNDSQNSSTNGLTHCWTGCFLEEGSTNSPWKASHWTFWDSWVNAKIRYCYNLIVRICVILRLIC